jgi:hypothetical protein
MSGCEQRNAEAVEYLDRVGFVGGHKERLRAILTGEPSPEQQMPKRPGNSTVPEADCPGHEFQREGKWQKCRRCDYLEPIGMTYMPDESQTTGLVSAPSDTTHHTETPDANRTDTP